MQNVTNFSPIYPSWHVYNVVVIYPLIATSYKIN